jgi:cellulose synthase operon protein C
MVTHQMKRFMWQKRNVGALIAALLTLQLTGCGSPDERAQRYYENGEKLLAQHDAKKAAIEFRNAIQQKNNLLPAWRGLAQSAELDSNWQALVPALRRILELEPTDGEIRLKLTKLYLAAGAPDQALKLINDAPEQDANKGAFLGLKAVVLYKLKDNVGALRDAKAALGSQPDNVDALVVLAADRLANDDPREALRLLSTDALMRTINPGIELVKIKAYEKLGDWAQLEATLRKLAEQYPQEAAFRRALVAFYIGQHRNNEAETELRSVATAERNNVSAELELVQFIRTNKGAASAREELVDRIRSNGDVFPYQMALAELDYSQGDFENSRKILEGLRKDGSSSEHALEATNRLAEMLIGGNDLAAADGLLAAVLNQDGRNAAALTLRASLRLRRGEVDGAISDLGLALEKQPKSMKAVLLLAAAYERNGWIELAEKQYADALRTSEYDSVVALNYASFLQRHGNIERAESVLSDLSNRQPTNTVALSALAQTKLMRQDWTGAQAVAETMRKLGDGKGIADRIIGTALGAQNKDAQSIAFFQDALAATPTAVQPMASLVKAYVKAKQSDKAIAFLQDVLRADPANANAYVLLGEVQLVSNAPDLALKYFSLAIEKQPKEGEGYIALASFYFHQGNALAAAETLRSGLKQLPDNLSIHMALAGVLEQAGQYDGAVTEYEFILAAQPQSMVAANNLASLLADHRSDKASLERAQALSAILRQSQIPQFKDTLGWVNYRRGDYNAAIPLLEQAASALPDNALVHYHLGMSYSAKGQEANAAKQLNLALSKTKDAALEKKIRFELRAIVAD